MDHFTVCQLCSNCKKGSKVFKVKFCAVVSLTPSLVLELRWVERERKEKIEQLVQDLISLLNDY